MKKILLHITTCILFTLTAFAQDFPKVEVSGGYSYFAPSNNFSGSNPQGWQGSIAGNFTDRFGLVAEANGHYQSVSGLRNNFHGFHFGPRFSLRNSRATLFAHVLPGFTRNDYQWQTISTSIPTTINAHANAFSLKTGGGVDVKLTSRLALRAIQADWHYSRFGGGNQNNTILSTRIVVAF